MYPSFNALVLAEHAAGRGVTVRAGVGWAKRTVAEIQWSCSAVTPNPTSVVPDPVVIPGPYVVYGTGFGGVVGQLHLGDHSTWAACVIKRLQPVSLWTGVRIDCPDANVEPPWLEAWVYVLNEWGLRNANGLHVDLLPI